MPRWAQDTTWYSSTRPQATSSSSGAAAFAAAGPQRPTGSGRLRLQLVSRRRGARRPRSTDPAGHFFENRLSAPGVGSHPEQTKIVRGEVLVAKWETLNPRPSHERSSLSWAGVAAAPTKATTFPGVVGRVGRSSPERVGRPPPVASGLLSSSPGTLRAVRWCCRQRVTEAASRRGPYVETVRFPSRSSWRPHANRRATGGWCGEMGSFQTPLITSRGKPPLAASGTVN